MKITLLVTGKTDAPYLKEGIAVYQNRLKHYVSFTIREIPELKNAKSLSEEQQKLAEAELIFKHLALPDHLVLLDENGAGYTSEGFAALIGKRLSGNVQHLVFLVGGPYGFHETLHKRAAEKIALSQLTFSHQMVRLFFTEQLYRAFTILNREPYHHK